MKTIILILFIGIVSCKLTAQNYDLLGIVDSELIKIDPATNDIEIIGKLNPSPSNLIRLLTYVEEDCMIYGIMVKSNRPWLISIDLNLNFTEVGILNLPGNTAYFSEGFAYNEVANKLYAAVSIDGSTANGDYASETIVEVDRNSGACTYITEIVGNVLIPDIDRMSFIDNILYFCDGAPGQWLKFFELDFSNLNFTTQAVELLSVSYTPVKDLQSIDDRVYYTNGTDVLFFDPGIPNITNEGILFDISEFNGEVITGICLNPFADYLKLEDEIIICQGEKVFLELDYPYEFVTWNNGSSGNSIIITESGLYWAEIIYNNCTFRTDTIVVTYIEPLDNTIGTSATICEEETIILNIDDSNVSVVWSDGSTGPEFVINETGFYWAQYIKDGCEFSTDTIYVEVVQVEIEIPFNIELCDGESYVVSLEGVGQNISWNNGYTGNQLIITESGLYWAIVTINGCDFLTDTIEASFIYPIQNFTVSDTAICNGETIYLTFPEHNIDLLWSNGSTENEIAISEEGFYWLQYVKEGCTFFTDTFYVTVIDGAYDIGSDITLCEGDSYLLSLEGVGQNVSWNNGYTGSQLVLNEAGTYWAAIILDNCQFTTDTIVVTMIPTVTTEIGSDTILCGDEEILLSVQNPILNYQWSTGEVGHSIVVDESGTYWASVINYECPSNIDSVVVSVIPDPVLTFEIDTIMCEDKELIVPYNEYGIDINWQDVNDEELVSIVESGLYWGSFQIENCLFYTDTIEVEFVDCSPCEYYIPNIISPNFDGINDEFKVVFSNTCIIEEIELMLFDRWGNLVCMSNENFWNGMFNNKIVNNGVYIYSINLTVQMYNGEMQEINVKGDVTVLK